MTERTYLTCAAALVAREPSETHKVTVHTAHSPGHVVATVGTSQVSTRDTAHGMRWQCNTCRIVTAAPDCEHLAALSAALDAGQEPEGDLLDALTPAESEPEPVTDADPETTEPETTH